MFGKKVDKIATWGMGRYGYELYQMCVGAGIKIEFYIDSSEQAIRNSLFPCKAITFDKFCSMSYEKPIVVAVARNEEICHSLSDIGYKKNIDYITMDDLMDRIYRQVGL